MKLALAFIITDQGQQLLTSKRCILLFIANFAFQISIIPVIDPGVSECIGTLYRIFVNWAFPVSIIALQTSVKVIIVVSNHCGTSLLDPNLLSFSSSPKLQIEIPAGIFEGSRIVCGNLSLLFQLVGEGK